MQVFLRQAILGILVVLSALTLTFILVRLSGDPTSIILPQDATEAQRALLREQLGLNQSLVTQFLSYLGNAVTGDFGKSYFDSESVTSIVMRHLPNTLVLAGASLAIACLFALPLGVMAAVWRDGPVDRFVQVAAVIGASMPSFWVGLLLIQVFAVGLNLFPTYGTGSAAHLALPALTLAIYAFPSLARLTRSSMLEVLPQSYVMAARAKGMPESRVISRTVLRNGMVPVLTLLALEIGNLIGGAVLTETVFAWEGIGRLAITSIQRRDFPVVQGVVAYVAVGFVIVTFLAEVAIRFVNPRLRHK
ncbi:dipeptide/oligopeptide/nickel ABC transporter permease [Nitratireductor indicus C115]|uniref:Dipeptide/oligopeptide/nickel ABC transporter permease n=1 Tax=Nitratireductor indicus C115 TaxID=1231190 RepID=K2NXM5_9HYPH|nr:ABC transporter permease [Nitratireductor indicus]EKF42639.1 dipeptide/oligopeptide/nickel ABC transporter permease [Nitratireductor indicus C115]SFQ38082.1 peptide/nickel transport system permease protein [Nitratireductor indicus]